MKKKKPPSLYLIKKNLFAHLSDSNYQPSTLTQLKKSLKILPHQAKAFEKILEHCVLEKRLLLKKSTYLLAPKAKENTIQGEIFINRRGFAFVHIKDSKESIFIPKNWVKGAVTGDKVAVHVTKDSSPKGPEGKVIRIVQRKLDRLVVTLTKKLSLGVYYAFSPLLGASHALLVKGNKSLKIGDRVYVEVMKWQDKNSSTEAKVVKKLGNIDDPSCDMLCSCLDFNIPLDFPSSVLKEVQDFPSKVVAKDLEGREDFRQSTCLTIDPDTAKDFDDAITIHKRQGFQLGVHIADVSHYVKEGSYIDKEAYQRANSTYFPEACIPMLPFALSNELCSLKPRVNRLTFSVIMHFDTEGELLNYRLTPSVIKSSKRFTYGEALEVLEKKKSSKFSKELKWMTELCLLLKKKRKERGSIEFSLPENKIYVDEEGKPEKASLIEYDITHQMIEEFMLKANEVVAQHLSKKDLPLPYRIHEEPKEESLQDFSTFARLFGFRLSQTPSHQEIQAMFDKLHERPEIQRLLSILFIKSMKLAAYSTDNLGHYGLALEHYCHFTSPIRRYSDLVVHRLLKEGLANQELDYSSIAEHCSSKERQSAQAESQVHTLKKLRLLKKLKEKDPHFTYSATLTSVKTFGLMFEIDDYLFEGFLSISQLDNDYFEFIKEKQALIGKDSGLSYQVGGRIQVLLMEVDFIKLESNWALVPTLSPTSIEKRKKSKKKTRNKKKFLGLKKGKKLSKKKRSK